MANHQKRQKKTYAYAQRSLRRRDSRVTGALNNRQYFL
jgi:hypothetical protein